MQRRVLLLAGMTAVWPRILLAQSPDQAEQKADQSVRVGDRWTYAETDQITGDTKATSVSVVTQVSDKEFDTLLSVRGKPGARIVAFDHDWNRIDDSLWKFKPHDGLGIRSPLTVGKEWRSEFESNNMQSGTVLNGTVRSKVTAQESVTTEAGTFDTFRIEHHLVEYMTTDPSKGSEDEIVIWYAPRINHWVKRTAIIRIEKRIRSSTSLELVDFSRKL
jgi:hypothetical protein